MSRIIVTVEDSGTITATVEASDILVLLPQGTAGGGGGGGSSTWGGITGTLSDQTDLQTALDGKVDENAAITGATKTKITYDTKGLVTGGADATTSDIAEGSNLYFTDERAQDAVGAMVANSSTVALSYVDGTPSLTASVIAGSIGATELASTTVTPGSYTLGSFTVDADGRITAASSGTPDGNGIYTGSGTVPNGTKATMATNGVFTFAYSVANHASADALVIDDNNGGIMLKDPAGTAQFGTDGGQVSMANSDGSLIISTTDTVFTSAGGLGIKYAGDYSTAISASSRSIPDVGTVLSLISSNAPGTNLTFSGASSPYTLNSSTGTDVTITAGTGISITRTGNDLTFAFSGSTGITTLNTLTGATQTFATGTSGTDFAISSSGTTHTFNIPTASASNRGLLSSTDWSTFNSKQAAGNYFVDGGNSLSATATLGTNDNNTLAFETNNVTRATISSGASTGGDVTLTGVTANTSTVQDRLVIQTNSSGTAAAGFGGGILFQGESTTTDNRDMARISSAWVTATDVSRGSKVSIQAVNNAGALADVVVIDPTSNSGTVTIGTASAVTLRPAALTTATSFTVGNSSQTLTLGGSSGTVTVSSSATSGSAITIAATSNAGTSTAGVNIGNGINFSQTSGTRNYIEGNWNFTPTSGTAVHNQLTFSGTFNQTGGANGITRGIYLNQTLTAVSDMRLIEIAANGSNTKGVYQTGSSVVNNFVGKTGFGSTTAASEAVDITGNLSLTTAGNKIKIATGSNASVGSSTLVGGTVTVSTTAVTASSKIFLTNGVTGGTVGTLSVGTITAGTSFVINSSSASDTSTVNWWIIN